MDNKTNQVRIIGGQWRSRKIHFADKNELRPTADRPRETLFNWLQPVIHGARCLDAFAGSGVLGFESLSRGASHVTFIEKDRAVMNTLRVQAERLKTTDTDFVCTPCPAKHLNVQHPFDIVFLDPPFATPELITETAQWLETQNLLSQETFIYIELHKRTELPALPDNWTLHREKKAGQVIYRVFLRSSLQGE